MVLLLRYVRISYFNKITLKNSSTPFKSSYGALKNNCFLIQDESKYFSKEELEVINHLRKDL